MKDNCCDYMTDDELDEMIDTIKQEIKASMSAKSYKVGNRSVERHSPDKLREELAFYVSERNKRCNRNKGGPTKRKFGLRITRVYPIDD